MAKVNESLWLLSGMVITVPTSTGHRSRSQLHTCTDNKCIEHISLMFTIYLVSRGVQDCMMYLDTR